MKRGDDNGHSRRWFQEPMVWMLISIPASSVLVGIILLSLSIRSYDGLVADDYYRRGQEINRVLARDRYAQQHAISATLRHSSGELFLDLSHDGQLEIPDTLELLLLHRTRVGLDRSVMLSMRSDGRYRGLLEENFRGRFVVQLETTRWRISGETEWPTDGVISLRHP